jgi:hypothetical protein
VFCHGTGDDRTDLWGEVSSSHYCLVHDAYHQRTKIGGEI